MKVRCWFDGSPRKIFTEGKVYEARRTLPPEHPQRVSNLFDIVDDFGHTRCISMEDGTRSHGVRWEAMSPILLQAAREGFIE